jgi:hypothetical protein
MDVEAILRGAVDRVILRDTNVSITYTSPVPFVNKNCPQAKAKPQILPLHQVHLSRKWSSAQAKSLAPALRR